MSKRIQTVRKYWKKQNKQQLESRSSPTVQGPWELSFPEVPEDELRNALISFATDESKLFSESIGELGTLLAQSDPIYLLASFSFCFLSFSKAFPSKHDPTGAPILQAHGELMQVFSLKYGAGSQSRRSRKPDSVFKAEALIRDIMRSFHTRRVQADAETGSQERFAKLDIIEDMRSSTQAVRNWGYSEQMFRIIEGLFRPLERDIRRVVGVSVSELISVFQSIIDELRQRIERHAESLGRFKSQTSIEGSAREYVLSIQRNDSAEGIVDAATSNGMSIEQLKQDLFAHSFLVIPQLFIFKLDWLASKLPIGLPVSTVQNLFVCLSLTVGGLHDANEEHFFLDNPVWRRPFIAINEETFFLPVPGLLRVSNKTSGIIC